MAGHYPDAVLHHGCRINDNRRPCPIFSSSTYRFGSMEWPLGPCWLLCRVLGALYLGMAEQAVPFTDGITILGVLVKMIEF